MESCGCIQLRVFKMFSIFVCLMKHAKHSSLFALQKSVGVISFPDIFQKEGLRICFTFLLFPKSMESFMHEKLSPVLV